MDKWMLPHSLKMICEKVVAHEKLQLQSTLSRGNALCACNVTRLFRGSQKSSNLL